MGCPSVRLSPSLRYVVYSKIIMMLVKNLTISNLLFTFNFLIKEVGHVIAYEV